MSADNGVYILITQSPQGSLCYRVAEFATVENLINVDGSLNRSVADCVYGNSDVYTISAEAWTKAIQIYRTLFICEYGVQEINFWDEIY